VEGIYYGFYYKGVWHPRNATDNVSLYGEIVNINNYYNESEIQQNFSGHHYWYVYNSSIGVVFHEECVHNFSYWAKDNVCHHSELYNHTFYVDATPPEATIEMPKCYRAVYGGKVDIVFLIDTSGSMNPVWDTLDSNLNSLINSIRSAGVDLNVTAYALEDLPGVALPNISSFTYPITTTWFNDSNISIPNDESWGTALSWIALWYPWREGAIRVAIPISDECAYDGDDGGPEDANDAQAVNESASLCHNNSVTVFPFYHTMFYTPPLACVPEMEKVANATGGEVFNITDLSGFSSVFLNIVRGVAIKESISCNATIHLSAIDYPITTGKVVDQKQTEANVYDGIENITFTPLYTAQSFVPSVDKLDAVQLLLDSGSGGTINVSIYNSGLQLLGYNETVLSSLSEEWIQFHFNPAINLTVGETYWIAVRAWPSTNISWMWYNMSDLYPNGIMIRSGSIDTAHDFAFKTEYYGDIEAACAAGLENIYYGYEYQGVWHPNSMDDNTSKHGQVFNISNYYNESEINSSFGGHVLWYVYNDSLGINFTQECKHELYYWAKDNICHHSLVYHRTLYVDNSPPNITKMHPSCYEVVNGTPYLGVGTNITLFADDMPESNCSSGTWLYWRYVWDNYTSNESEYYPFLYHEGFEEKPTGWIISYPWWGIGATWHDGNTSIGTVNDTSYIGWSGLGSNAIHLPDIPKITLTFWQRADNLSDYDASNMFGIINESGVFIPLKFFYKEDMSNDWQKVTIDLTPYANQTIKLLWIYENDYGKGEVWFIDDVNITGWYGVYGYENVTQNISFNEECHHTLYYFAEDTTCHNTTVHSQEYFVDGTHPDTNYENISTNCTDDAQWNATGNYWQACDWANISFVINNIGIEPCIYPYTFTYVRYVNKVWNESSQSFDNISYPDAAHGVLINGYYWYNITDTLYLNITEGCNHTIYYFSTDGVCNVEPVKTIEVHIDDMPPKTIPSFINFNCGEVPKVNNIYFINPHTLIGLNATDYPIGCASGVKETHYRVWKYNDSDGQFDIPLTNGWEIYTNPINLSKLVDENYSICGAYELWYNSSDNCCHQEKRNIMDLIVDCKPPTTTKEFAGNFVKGDIEGVNVTWVNNNTIIWLNATDGSGQRSGVKRIYWEIVNNVTDETNYSDNPYEHQKDYHHAISMGDLVSDFGLTDGRYDFFHWAIDRVCNEEKTHHKQWIVLDTSAPTSRVAQESLPPEPYNITTIPFDITVKNITDHGYNGGVGICKVEVYSSYSEDNTTWEGWALYATNTSLITNPDGSVVDWTLTFTAPNGSGYYRFRSIAYDCLGNSETPPFEYGYEWHGYDASCYVYADTEPPVIHKEDGQPKVGINTCGETIYALYALTWDTPIYINVTDLPDAENATGVNKLMIAFTPPGVQPSASDWINVPQSSWTTIEPGNSGHYRISYVFTPNNYSSYLNSGEIYHLYVYAADVLGHEVENKTQKFVVDDTAPTASITIEGNDTVSWDKRTFNITVNATDNAAGVKNITLYFRYSEDGVTWGNWMKYDTLINAENHKWHFKYAPAPTYYKPGYYQFYVYAEDKLGNNNGLPTVATTPMASCYVAPIPEDFNGDGRVNVIDLYQIISHWGDTGAPGWIPQDLHSDGVIDAGDIYQLITKWTG